MTDEPKPTLTDVLASMPPESEVRKLAERRLFRNPMLSPMTHVEAAEELRRLSGSDSLLPEAYSALVMGAEALEVLLAVEIQLDTNAADPGAVLHAIRWIVKEKVGVR
ncbi:MAG: hypothetical protein ACRD68_00030 [Pyrinomonadaceae bacterium]